MTPRYILDTNICAYLMMSCPEAIVRRFEQFQRGEVVMSAVTYCELEYGVAQSDDPARKAAKLADFIELIKVMPLDKGAGILYGPIRSASRKRRPRILDTLIVAHAVAMNVPLVTSKTEHFSGYPGVRVENWLEAA
jgi:tRNA(fMet)-specific endonuclease VapC